MPEAIRTDSFMDGLMRGVEFAGRQFDKKDRRERLSRQEDRQTRLDQQAISRYEYEKARQAEQDMLANERYTAQTERQTRLDNEAIAQREFNNDLALKAAADREKTNALSRQSSQTAIDVNRMNIGNDRKAKLLERAKQEWKRMETGAGAFPKELHDELIKNGMSTASPYYWMQPEVRKQHAALGNLLTELQSGNFDAVNQPQNLQIINTLYAEQIKRGLGETRSPFNGIIVDKKIVEMNAGPNGGYVPIVRNYLDNGDHYDAPLTVNRSTNPEDPVEVKDSGIALDDMISRHQLALYTDNPEVQAMIEKGYQSQFGVKQSTKDMSSTGKTIRDLVAYGLPQERAIEIATNSKQNPQAAISSLAGDILSNQDEVADDRLTPEQAYAKAKQIILGVQEDQNPVGEPSEGENGNPYNDSDQENSIIAAKGKVERILTSSEAEMKEKYPDARQAQDGNWYIQKNGKYFKVEL